jgi:hypothetical protein
MARKTDNPRCAHPEVPKVAPSARPKAGRIVLKIAKGTLLAAGLAAAQLGLAENFNDPRFPVFSPTLVDRLQEPITRYHE